MRISVVTAQALRSALERVNAFTGDVVSSHGRYGRITDSHDVSGETRIGHFTVPSEGQLMAGLWYTVHTSSSCAYYGADRNETWTSVLESRSSKPWTNSYGRTYAPLDEEGALALIAAVNALADKARGIRRAHKMLARGRCNPDQRTAALAAIRAV